MTGGEDTALTITGDKTVLNEGVDEVRIEINTEAVAGHKKR